MPGLYQAGNWDVREVMRWTFPSADGMMDRRLNASRPFAAINFQNVPVTSSRSPKSVSQNFCWNFALTGRTDRLSLEYSSVVKFIHTTSESFVVQDNTKQNDEVEQSGRPTPPTVHTPNPAKPILQHPVLPTPSGPTTVLSSLENTHQPTKTCTAHNTTGSSFHLCLAFTHRIHLAYATSSQRNFHCVGSWRWWSERWRWWCDCSF